MKFKLSQTKEPTSTLSAQRLRIKLLPSLLTLSTARKLQSSLLDGGTSKDLQGIGSPGFPYWLRLKYIHSLNLPFIEETNNLTFNSFKFNLTIRIYLSAQIVFKDVRNQIYQWLKSYSCLPHIIHVYRCAHLLLQIPSILDNVFPHTLRNISNWFCLKLTEVKGTSSFVTNS